MRVAAEKIIKKRIVQQGGPEHGRGMLPTAAHKQRGIHFHLQGKGPLLDGGDGTMPGQQGIGNAAYQFLALDGFIVQGLADEIIICQPGIGFYRYPHALVEIGLDGKRNHLSGIDVFFLGLDTHKADLIGLSGTKPG